VCRQPTARIWGAIGRLLPGLEALLRWVVVAGAAALLPMASARPESAAARPESAAARPASAGYLFAPYLDFTQYPPPNLSAIARGSRAPDVSVGFVTARQNKRCAATWGGYGSDPASGSNAYRRADLARLRRSGVSAIPSFGGQAGVELATVCPTATALERVYGGVVAAYGVHRVDFDIEGATVSDGLANDRRSAAIAVLQHTAAAAGGTLQVSFTLPVLPGGLDGDGLSVLRSAVSHGVRVDAVNLMTMDYGDSAAPHPSGRMGRYAVRAALSVQHELQRLYPRLSAPARLRMIGVTPMIGTNDVSSETFTLADARTVRTFARRHHLGMVSMWQLERDRRCARPEHFTQPACSGVSQRRYQFARTFGGG
jgi:hypothetical protein